MGSRSLLDFADMDSYQMRWVYGRPRDKHGRLRRGAEDLPDWVEVDADGMRVVTDQTTFSSMFHQVKSSQGLKPEQVKDAWQMYLMDNPKLAVVGHLRSA